MTSSDELKDIGGVVPSGKENKSNNNIEKVLSLTAEAYCDGNNLGENRVIEENTSKATENTGQEYNQTIKDFTRQKEHLPENDGTIQLHQVLKDEHNLPINKNDKSLTSIDESTLVKFRNNFFEAIEELRIQRSLDVENEERIKCLMTEKHELERKKEEAISKNNALVEQHAQQETDIKKQQEDRLLQYEEEKGKQTLAAECTEKELRVLKDEVRALHLVKYTLEKKIKEQERLTQLQNSARDSHESQMSALEQRSKTAFEQCTLLADLVEKTELNISAASRLHRKLMYTNEHQKCLLESYKRELDSKKFELVALKATLAQKKDSLMCDAETEVNRADALERELRMKTEVCRQSQSQLDDSRKENEKLMESLKEAHRLLGRHVQSINKHSELEVVAHLELDEIKTECQTLREALKKEKGEKQQMEDTMESGKVEWDEQKQVLESRVEDLQKEYDSLSEAHNSLEQLNSNWSEQNMEQKAKIASMLKEVDELKMSLSQAEESVQSQKEMNRQLQETLQNKTSSLGEKLLQAKQDCRSQTERANDLENKGTELKEKVQELEQKIINTEKEHALKSKETTDATSQTDDNQQISSLSEQLLKAKESCASQTERADYLETQCTLLNGRVDNLVQKIAQKEKEEMRKTDTINTAVQTDDMLKINLEQQQGGKYYTNRQVNGDLNINEPLEKESDDIQQQGEKTLKKKEITATGVPLTKVTLNLDHNRERQLQRENDHNRERQLQRENVQVQLKTDTESKESEKNTDKGRAPDPPTSNGLVSTNVLSMTTTVSPDALNNSSPQKTLPRKDGSMESNNVDQCENGKEMEGKDISVGVEIGMTDREIGIPSKPCCASDVGKQFETSTTSGNKDSVKDNDVDNAIPAGNNILRKEIPVAKKVRFNLEGTKTSSPAEAEGKQEKSKRQISKEESHMVFSDEEDEKSEYNSIDEAVSQRITRIQNMLRNDRLRTNRKRKFPVV